MKLCVLSAAIALPLLFGGALNANAQAVYQSQSPAFTAGQGNTPVNPAVGAQNYNRIVGPDQQALGRMQNSRADVVRDAIYKDQLAIKALKEKLKLAQTDEEKATIKSEIGQLQGDIIAMQQG